MPQEIFLKILKCAMRGERITEAAGLDPQQCAQVLRLAQIHRVLPLVYDTAYEGFALQEQDMLFLRQTSRMLVIQQATSTQNFLKLYSELSAKGLSPIVVKGIMCRELYPNPDLRLSSDEDLLILPEEFSEYALELANCGYRIAESSDTDNYEVSFVSGEGTHIELHKSLFRNESEYFLKWNSFFEGAEKRTCERNIQGVMMKTLSHTDHLLFLILHAMKHFIISGVGIRQICDIVMFSERFGENIDWDYVLECCTEVRAEVFAASLFLIGIKHLGFDTERACYPVRWQSLAVDETAMLKDVLFGGIYGSAHRGRRHSGGLTLAAVQGKKKGVLRRAFPSADSLSSEYDYARKNPLLLPVAWSQRLIRYSKEINTKSGNTPLESVRIAEERLRVLSDYGIID